MRLFEGTRLVLMLCLVVFGMWGSPALQAYDQPTRAYTIGVVPQFTPLVIHRTWRPFVKHISSRAGVHLHLKIYSGFREFMDDVLDGNPDFVFMAPYHAVLAHRAQGYEPLVRDDSTQLVGVLVVHKDSPYHTVQELEGKRISFPSPTAFAASVYMRAMLHEREGLSFLPRYVGTHGNVYRHVAHRLTAAGSGVNSTLEKQPVSLKDQLRVIYTIPGVPPHPVCVHPRVPEEVRGAVRDEILEMGEAPGMRDMLNAVQMPQPVPADYERDYEFLGAMGLGKYWGTEGR